MVMWSHRMCCSHLLRSECLCRCNSSFLELHRDAMRILHDLRLILMQCNWFWLAGTFACSAHWLRTCSRAARRADLHQVDCWDGVEWKRARDGSRAHAEPPSNVLFAEVTLQNRTSWPNPESCKVSVFPRLNEVPGSYGYIASEAGLHTVRWNYVQYIPVNSNAIVGQRWASFNPVSPCNVLRYSSMYFVKRGCWI